MKAPRVLLAVGPLPPPINGLSTAFELVVTGLSARGWGIRVVDIADRSPPRKGSSLSLPRARAVLRALSRSLVELTRARLVYLTISQSRFGFAKDVVVLQAAAFLGVPTVVHMHGGNFGGFFRSLTWLERRAAHRILDGIARIIVLTEGLKDDFSMLSNHRQRAVAISNACSYAPGKPKRLRPDELGVLFLSNLIVAKGYRETILAVSSLAARNPHVRVRLDIAGGFSAGADFVDERAQKQDLCELFAGLPPNVVSTYHGVVDGEVKARLLRDADIFVLPTSYVNEGQPISLLEALAFGLPVIATDWRGISESVPDVMRQLFVPPADPERIAERLAWLSTHPDLYASLSNAAVEHAVLFNPERHLEAVDAVLRSVVEPSS